MGRIAFYGGSFDPVHLGHLEIARRLTAGFELDEFVFIPAFHAPHKRENKPASPFQRFAMLSLVTESEHNFRVSTIELDDPEHPYSIETLSKLNSGMPDEELFFVIGADSWQEITTWRRWEEVLSIVNIIVVTRPGIEITFEHVNEEIQDRIVDLRQQTGDVSREKGVGAAPVAAQRAGRGAKEDDRPRIYITDSVNVDVSATAIRKLIREGMDGWKKMVPEAASRFIEKYGLYR